MEDWRFTAVTTAFVSVFASAWLLTVIGDQVTLMRVAILAGIMFGFVNGLLLIAELLFIIIQSAIEWIADRRSE